jgi:hypothetical protein
VALAVGVQGFLAVLVDGLHPQAAAVYAERRGHADYSMLAAWPLPRIRLLVSNSCSLPGPNKHLTATEKSNKTGVD